MMRKLNTIIHDDMENLDEFIEDLKLLNISNNIKIIFE